MKRARLICLLAIAIMMLGFVMDSSAQAQGPGAFGSGRCGNYFGYYASPYSLGQIPVPPYFSLHPPVYYSVPVPRTYGYSPYAYPGWVRTPDVEIVEPEVIDNPHVDKPQIEETKTASYRIIDNPFVRADLKARLSTQYAAFDPVQ